MDFESQLQEFGAHYHKLKELGRVQEEVAPYAFVLHSAKKSTSNKDIDLLFLGLLHGNEVGGIAVLNHILRSIFEGKFKPDIKMAFALGNVEAGKKNVRFIEKDLNRIFGSTDKMTAEDRRATELEALLKRSQFVVDIHQTIEPTASPFFIFGYDEKSFIMARTLAPSLPIISYSLKDRRDNGVVATGYSIDHGGVAVTIELGQKGFEQSQIDLGYGVCRRAYWYVKNQRLHRIKNFITSTFLRRSKPHPEDKVLVFSYRHLNEGDLNDLKPGYTNFMKISKGEKLGTSSLGDIIAPIDGRILFPKYGAAKRGSKELFVILEEFRHKDFLKKFDLK